MDVAVRKEPSPDCCHKLGSTPLSIMSLYAVALIFPQTLKNSPRQKGHKDICPDTHGHIVHSPLQYSDQVNVLYASLIVTYSH